MTFWMCKHCRLVYSNSKTCHRSQTVCALGEKAPWPPVLCCLPERLMPPGVCPTGIIVTFKCQNTEGIVSAGGVGGYMIRTPLFYSEVLSRSIPFHSSFPLGDRFRSFGAAMHQ